MSRLHLTFITVLAFMCFPIPQVPGQITAPEGKTRLALDFEDASIWKSENNNPFGVLGETDDEPKVRLAIAEREADGWYPMGKISVVDDNVTT